MEELTNEDYLNIGDYLNITDFMNSYIIKYGYDNIGETMKQTINKVIRINQSFNNEED